MVKFFKINDPFRFAVLAVGFIILRAFIFYFDFPLTHAELRFFIPARAISDGKWLYRDLWETTEPLTTLVFYFLPKTLHYFQSASYWLNVVLILFNAFHANHFLQKFDVFSDKTYLPGLFYLLLSLVFIELDVLSAPLLASCFLLFVVRSTFSYLKKEEPYRMYDAGFFLGAASLFFLPSILFALGMIFTLLFFTRSQSKAYLLFLLGFSFPWIIVVVIYLWVDGTDEFTRIFVSHYFRNYYNYIDIKELLYILLLPLGMLLIGIFFSLRGIIREINYQSICRRFTFVWLLVGIGCFMLSPFKTHSLLHLILFPCTFYFTYYYIQAKKLTGPSIALTSFLLLTILFQYLSLNSLLWKNSILKSTVRYEPNPLFSNKTIWVAGLNSSYYLDGKVATKYLNWDVSKDDFANTQKFFALENIRLHLYKGLPEVIIDDDSTMSNLFIKIPQLKKKYTFIAPNIYLINESNNKPIAH